MTRFATRTPSAPLERDVIPMAFVREAIVPLRARGVDADAALSEAGIEPASLEGGSAFVTPDQFTALWRVSVERLQDELFGLDARGMPPGSYTLMCHAVLHSPNLERALARALRFLGILLSDFEGRLIRKGRSAEIIFVERGPPRPPLAYGALLVLLQGLACWLIDTRIPLLRVEFRGEDPGTLDHYRKLFCEDLKFGQPQTRIQFDAQFLSYKLWRTEAQMKAFLRDAPRGFLTRYRNRDSYSATIWRMFREQSPEDWPDFKTVAESFHMTRSTLRRRLSDERVTYQDLKDRVRRDRAIAMLRAGGQSNTEIAAKLGFGDPSAFYRAFRKWTGATPTEYRVDGGR